jgi:hypothetical protein
MATLHANRGRLPDDRADLYNESVDLLMLRWNRQIGADKALLDELAIPTLKLSDLRGGAGGAGLQGPRGERRDGRERTRTPDGTADIGEDRLVRAFRPLLQAAGTRRRWWWTTSRSEPVSWSARARRTASGSSASPIAPSRSSSPPVIWQAQDDFPAECARLARAAAGSLAGGAAPGRPAREGRARRQRGRRADRRSLDRRAPKAQRPEAADWTCALLAGMQLQEIGLGAIGEAGAHRARSGAGRDWIAASLPVHPDDGGHARRKRARLPGMSSPLSAIPASTRTLLSAGR